MPVVQLADIIQPEFFSQYMAENSMVSTALFRSGVLVPNALMESQISARGDTVTAETSATICAAERVGFSIDWVSGVSKSSPRSSGTNLSLRAVLQIDLRFAYAGLTTESESLWTVRRLGCPSASQEPSEKKR
jgi:hypothetical protein